jgi:hypothetical protein
MGLRQRKLSEDQVADVLRELQSHLQETGQRPEEAFGGPKEYAARFPPGSTVSPGTKVAYLAAFTLMAIITVKVFTGEVLGISLGFPGTFIYLGATALVTFALIAWSTVLQRKLTERMTEELSKRCAGPSTPPGTCAYLYATRWVCSTSGPDTTLTLTHSFTPAAPSTVTRVRFGTLPEMP